MPMKILSCINVQTMVFVTTTQESVLVLQDGLETIVVIDEAMTSCPFPSPLQIHKYNTRIKTELGPVVFLLSLNIYLTVHKSIIYPTY